jgi:hypothetical protein
MELVEHRWHCGASGWILRDVFLRSNPEAGQWEVEERVPIGRGGLTRSTVREFATEDEAWRILNGLTAIGTWQSVGVDRYSYS